MISPPTAKTGRTSPTSRLNLSTVALALLIILGSAAYVRAETPLPTPQQGPVSYAALMRFEQSSNEMTGAPKWVDLSQRPMWSDMAELYVQADTPPLRPDASQDGARGRYGAAGCGRQDQGGLLASAAERDPGGGQPGIGQRTRAHLGAFRRSPARGSPSISIGSLAGAPICWTASAAGSPANCRWSARMGRWRALWCRCLRATTTCCCVSRTPLCAPWARR